jgi:acetoin utilization protein AcuC
MTQRIAMLVDDPTLARSPFGEEHPFRAERGAITRTLLEATGALLPDDVAPVERLDERLLGAVHDAAYLEAVVRAGRGERVEDPRGFGLDTSDCPIVPGMHRVALRVADASVSAAELVASGTALRALHLTGGMHHAHRARASGFCLVNDLALAIEHLTRRHGWRVAYLDLDAHHGDGVQAAFWERGDVLTLSMHQSGRTLFPGTGAEDELGAGPGLGTSVNLPLDPFTDDAGALAAFDALVPDVVASFRPDVIVLQAGVDAHWRDPLARLALTGDGLDALFTRVIELSERWCGGRMVVTGGGGYDAWRSVPRAWARLWGRLSQRDLPDDLPEAWRAHWAERLGATLPATLGERDRPALDPLVTERAASHALAVARRVGQRLTLLARDAD